MWEESWQNQAFNSKIILRNYTHFVLPHSRNKQLPAIVLQAYGFIFSLKTPLCYKQIYLECISLSDKLLSGISCESTPPAGQKVFVHFYEGQPFNIQCKQPIPQAPDTHGKQTSLSVNDSAPEEWRRQLVTNVQGHTVKLSITGTTCPWLVATSFACLPADSAILQGCFSCLQHNMLLAVIFFYYFYFFFQPSSPNFYWCWNSYHKGLWALVVEANLSGGKQIASQCVSQLYRSS